MGWYQSGDPGFFDFIGKAATNLFGTATRAALGQRYTATPGALFSGMRGGFGGLLQAGGALVGLINPAIGAGITGAGALMAQGTDTMGYSGQGITDPNPDLGSGYTIQPYNQMPNFVNPTWTSPMNLGTRQAPVYEEYDEEDYY